MTTTFVLPTLQTPDWQHRAACRDEDPELFFPIGDTAPAARNQIAQALTVCARCPVLEQCRDFGMTQDAGIWGGMTERERRGRRAQIAREAIEADVQAATSGERFPENPNVGEARRLFREVLAELQASGKTTVATKDIPPAFYARVRSRAWALNELNRLATRHSLARTTVAGVFVFAADLTALGGAA